MGVAFWKDKRLGSGLSAVFFKWVTKEKTARGSGAMWAQCGYSCGESRIKRSSMDFQSEIQDIWTVSPECYRQSINLALDQLNQPGNDPPFYTYISLLRSCSTLKALPDGKRLHKHIAERGLASNMLLGSLIVQMYGECGALEDAGAAFANMHVRNVFAWNVMIRAYVLDGEGRQALCLFQRMQQEGINPDKVTLVSMLSVCASENALAEGKWIHTLVLDTPFTGDVSLQNALVNMYCKCGSLEKARRELEKMKERNVISWTVMIAAYAQNRRTKHALLLFRHMQQEGILPDKVTFISILDACAIQGARVEGEKIHARLVNCEFESDTVVSTALINLHAKCGCLANARILFDKMVKQNVVAWTAMITAYADHGQGKEALQLFHRMHLEGFIPNKVTIINILDAIGSQEALVQGKQIHVIIVCPEFELDDIVDTALINMYGKCHSLEDARRAFEQNSQGDVVTWTALIAVHVQNEQGLEGLQIFLTMLQQGVIPNRVTFVSILDACANETCLSEGKQIHLYLFESGLESDIAVGNALIHMYGKCGCLADAQETFDSMGMQDVVSWNSMIAVYAQHGHGKAALHIFQQMCDEGVPHDRVTFLSILSACSHTGLVAEGFQCFVSMYQDHGIVPAVGHYNCMIDLLGRAGRLDEAEDLVNNMQLRPSLVSSIALLGACRYHGDCSRGERAAKLAFDLDPDNDSAYLMLSNMYITAGRVESEEVMARVQETGLEKQADFKFKINGEMTECLIWRDAVLARFGQVY